MSLPTSMRYIDHGTGGPPSSMRVAQGPLPVLKAGEVLIEVAYAGVNRPDIAQRMGAYPPPPGASPYLGLEVAGRVVARADDVTAWQLGDEVCALTPGGGYAEYCATQASHCLPVPKGLSLRDAASLPENYFTVWHNVFGRGGLKAGETLLVHGGSSGIGLCAIQMAKAFGATVYTTAGTSEKIAATRRVGADAAINHREQDWAAEITTLTAGHGVNVILDMVGAAYTARNLQALAIEGRLVQIAVLMGAQVELNLATIMIKRLTLTGSTLRPQSVAAKAAIARDLLEKIWPLIEAGRARTIIHAEFDLAQATAAHELMESQRHIGKIMLRVR